MSEPLLQTHPDAIEPHPTNSHDQTSRRAPWELQADTRVDLWRTFGFRLGSPRRGSQYVNTIGRLREGVALAVFFSLVDDFGGGLLFLKDFVVPRDFDAEFLLGVVKLVFQFELLVLDFLILLQKCHERFGTLIGGGQNGVLVLGDLVRRILVKTLHFRLVFSEFLLLGLQRFLRGLEVGSSRLQIVLQLLVLGAIAGGEFLAAAS